VLERVPGHAKALFRRGQAGVALKARAPDDWPASQAAAAQASASRLGLGFAANPARGCAQAWDAALADLAAAAEAEPGDAGVCAELARARKLRDAAQQRERAAYQRMFT
jgi:hypothetical protein